MFEFLRNTIGFYSLIAIIGLLSVLVVLFIFAKKRGLPGWQPLTMVLFAMAGLLVGSHLLYFIVGLPDWIPNYAGRIHSFSDLIVALGYGASGMVFYGGLFGAYLGIIVFCKIYKFSPLPELNMATVVFPLFHFFGRLGCWLNGCCYGIEYHGPLAVHYDSSYIVEGISDDIADFPRFPVQVLEAVLELALFIFLIILYKKAKDKYSLTSIYLLLYSVIRFLDEFLRGDAIRKIWGPFSTSQWISLFVFAGVLIYLFIKQKKTPGKKFFECSF
ncbi:MAG: prolipoprotein diacylglyceryl transferase [Lachnospiraceae bacterium]|jgi:phosphatidylglycerol:prolipoprotein diacylglycerol transferase